MSEINMLQEDNFNERMAELANVLYEDAEAVLIVAIRKGVDDEQSIFHNVGKGSPDRLYAAARNYIVETENEWKR